MNPAFSRLLKSLNQYHKLAAKLSLGPVPSMPKDPNFTGIVDVPEQNFAPVAPDLVPRGLESGVLPRPAAQSQTQSQIIKKMTERSIEDAKQFNTDFLTWAANPKNKFPYKNIYSDVKSLISLLEDINASAHITEDKLDPVASERYLKYLNDMFKVINIYYGRLIEIPSYKQLYFGLLALKQAMGLPEVENSVYDMFAEEDAEEDMVDSGSDLAETQKVMVV